LVLKIEVKVGSKYLTGSNYTGAVWSNTAGYYLLTTVFYPFFSDNNRFFTTFSDEYRISTPDVQATGAGEWKVSLVRVLDSFGINVTSQISTIDIDLRNVIISMVLGNENITVENYKSELTTSSKYKIDTGGCYLGDGLVDATAGALQVWNGSAWVYSTSKWRRHDTGTFYPIGELRVMELHALCQKPVYMLQGSWFGRSTNMPQIDMLYNYLGEKYIATVGTLMFDDQTISGEMYRISQFDIETITGDSTSNTGELPLSDRIDNVVNSSPKALKIAKKLST
jgi:hypothetical protein